MGPRLTSLKPLGDLKTSSYAGLAHCVGHDDSGPSIDCAATLVSRIIGDGVVEPADWGMSKCSVGNWGGGGGGGGGGGTTVLVD